MGMSVRQYGEFVASHGGAGDCSDYSCRVMAGVAQWAAYAEFLDQSMTEVGYAALPPARLAKLQKLASAAKGSTGKAAQTRLVSLVRKAGLTVVPGGKHLKIIDPATGRTVSIIPHSPRTMSIEGTIKDIGRFIGEKLL